MRIEWSATGARLIGLRGRDRDIEELQLHGATGKSYVVKAKLREIRFGNELIEEASEIYIESKEEVQKVAELKFSDVEVTLDAK